MSMSRRDWIRQLTIIAIALAAGALASIAVIYAMDRQSAPEIVIDDPRDGAEMVVSVKGAVATPGTYRLAGDARVKDAVDAAGGTTSDADLSGINMAARVTDEQELVIPAKQTSAQGLIAGTPPASDSESEQININTASAAELDELPGIGEVLAARIVAYREEHGPFESVDALAQVDGISIAMVDEIRSMITV
jgi:competence protein ComEA